MQANRTYIYAKKKHPFASYPAAKHPKHSKLAVADVRQKPVDLFNNTARAVTSALAIIFKSQVPSQKFPFLLRYTIPCYDDVSISELSLREICYISVHT